MPACFHCLAIAFWQLLNTWICYVSITCHTVLRVSANGLCSRMAHYTLCYHVPAAWQHCLHIGPNSPDLNTVDYTIFNGGPIGVSRPWRVSTTTTRTVLWPFFQEHPGELVPEENFWTLWCKGRLTEADTTIQLGATPSGLTSAHLHHPAIFFYKPDALPATRLTVSKHWRQLAHSD